jgi:S1-C subfamily serine protease
MPTRSGASWYLEFPGSGRAGDVAEQRVLGQERDPPGAALVVEIQSGTGLGSGIVYDGNGYIMTNAHV